MNNGEIERQRDEERRREAWRRVEASRVPCEMHTVEDTRMSEKENMERGTMTENGERRNEARFVASKRDNASWTE